MDVDDSDGEPSLPTGLDPAVKTDLNDDTLSTFQSATVTEPQLPNRARKRTNEEIYEKVQRPFVSTTPLKSPPRNPVSARAMSEPFHERGTSFDKVGFSALRDVTKANQETSARTRSNDEPDSEMAGEETPEQEADAETFTDQINSYKQELQRDFAEYEKALACKSQTDTEEPLDWGDLETRYRRDMQPLTAEEEKVTAEFEVRLQVRNYVHVKSIAHWS